MKSALSRHESRELHYSKDYPQTLPEARSTILTQSNYYSLLDSHHGEHGHHEH